MNWKELLELSEFLQVFWSRVDKTDACWHWTAAKSRAGYGQIGFDGKLEYAHRISHYLIVLIGKRQTWKHL